MNCDVRAGQYLQEEGVDVGLLFNDLGGWFAPAVAGFCFDAEENGIYPGGLFLEGGDEFLGVRGNDAVVGIRRGNKNGRIIEAGPDIVERRVGVEILELVLVGFGAAVLRYPVAADGELVVPEHVGNGDLADNGAEEPGPLEHTGGNEQPAVTPASYGKLFGAGVLVCDEAFGGGDEVVKDVLLFVEHAGLVPGLAVFPTASHIGDGIYAAVLKPDERGDGKTRLDADVEPAIAVKQGRIAAVKTRPFLWVIKIGTRAPSLE